MKRSIVLLLYWFSVTCEIYNVIAEGTDSREPNFPCKNVTSCIMKCCPHNTYVNVVKKRIGETYSVLRTCSKYKEDKNILSIDNFYNFVDKMNMSIFNVTTAAFLADGNFPNNSVDISNLNMFNIYLTESKINVNNDALIDLSVLIDREIDCDSIKIPELHLEVPNAYNRWIHLTNSKFCIDYKIVKDKKTSNESLSPGIWVLLEEEKDTPSRTSTTLMTAAMLVSCFFLLVVLVVYGLLPELRNLCGMILMAYVGSQMFAFVLLSWLRIKTPPKDGCIILSSAVYFFFLASFCWMNVMSYDIWWTFRGYAKARPIHRRGERFKFAMYCLYAWGLPLGMAIMLVVLNNSTTKMKKFPWFITPKIPSLGCFIEGGEKLLYLYIPMLILIISNWLFYLMTGYNVWRLSRGTAVLDSAAAGSPAAHRTHRQRFMVYVKLSVVMGLNWVLEVISFALPGHYLWFLTDFYNILIGVSIFLIFVCKRKILKKLMKLSVGYKKSRWYPGNSTRSDSTSDSQTSQETQTLQVCNNPKGPGYAMKNV